MVLCNPTVYIGTDFSISFCWKENGIALDLTGYRAKAKASNVAASYVWSSDAGQIELSADGTVTIKLDSTFTATMLPGSYVWDMLLMTPNLAILPPKVTGVLTILMPITNWQ
jgi:hypothetical protein